MSACMHNLRLDTMETTPTLETTETILPTNDQVLALLRVSDAEHARLKHLAQDFEALDGTVTKNEEWLKARSVAGYLKRVSGSVIGRIMGSNPWNPPPKELTYFIQGETFSDIAKVRMNWGTQNEGRAREAFVLQLSEDTGGTVVVDEFGMIVDQDQPWLSYSPDGVVHLTVDGKKKSSLLEIKCPHTKRYATDENVGYKDCKWPNGKVGPVTRNYYYQIQMGMYMLGLDQCYFVAWAPRALRYHLIPYDKEWFEGTVLPAIKAWYFDRYLPALRIQLLADGISVDAQGRRCTEDKPVSYSDAAQRQTTTMPQSRVVPKEATKESEGDSSSSCDTEVEDIDLSAFEYGHEPTLVVPDHNPSAPGVPGVGPPPKRQKTTIVPRTFNVAGISFRKEACRVVHGLGVPDMATLVPEPTNPYDPNAIAVHMHGQHVGYVPRVLTTTLLPLCPCDVGVVEFGPFDAGFYARLLVPKNVEP
jgi:hypothetical protein